MRFFSQVEMVDQERLIDQYENFENLGEDLYGEVFKAQHCRTKEMVTIKKINLDQENGPPATVIREISLLKELQHNNIVRLQNAELSGKGIHLVFEYLDMDFKKLMKSSPDLAKDPNSRKTYLHQILEGVAYCHSHQVLHQDLKLESLLMDQHTNTVKLADFGLCRTFSIAIHAYSNKWNVAPEILLGSECYFTLADMWSLGCIFAEMVNQRPLFSGISSGDVLREIFSALGTPDEETWPGVTSLPAFDTNFPIWLPKNLAEVVPNLEPEGVDLLSKMLCMDPRRRITSRDALKHDYFLDLGVLLDLEGGSPVSTVMGQYEQLEKLGEGSCGVVYKAKHCLTREIVALKKIKHISEDGFPKAIIREISHLKDLQHDNIVRLLDVDIRKDGIYLVFEYLDLDFKKHMDSCPELAKDPHLIKLFLCQILRGIAYCHSRNVLHRDLKPKNLLIDRHKNVLKLADFGLSRAFRIPLSDYTPVIATLWYRAPEILLGSLHYSTSVDMWSVGCIFAEMVSRKPLFNGDSRSSQLSLIFKILGTPSEETWPGVTSLPKFNPAASRKWFPMDLARVVPNLDSAGIDLLSKMLCMDPSRRITAQQALAHHYFKDLGFVL